MQLNTVIFDIDGLLVDSEPLWGEAAAEVFQQYGVSLTEEQYVTTTGLRTKEFLQWWFRHFNIGDEELARAEKNIVYAVLNKIERKGRIMPSVPYIFDFFTRQKFRIGLATSSPPALIDLVVGLAGIKDYVKAACSAESLPYGKPHPQVYLNCAENLGARPYECICFEDSFNGMIAAKAARMKCVVVPHHSQSKEDRWAAADLKLSSLQNFGELHFNLLANR
ncbi:hexitol phosphatase HxpB [Sediminibacterium soli]|uniref:hexitol phosphatase HxpB n=1 Tax=Sediminibacterium soli TaxID=2698829 RepID=UPI00137A94F8|nr:hexitol phosphatase HxpB [Sediminibacterium soli]NCI47158.1 hexitol phosphatase HxpB [Sediminibacterium soli]